jgi:hypothetical protein
MSKLNDDHISLRLPREQREALEAAAAADRRPVAAMARIALQDWLASRPGNGREAARNAQVEVSAS